jgi:glycerate kinase
LKKKSGIRVKFVLSPDSFKESMTAQKVTQVMKKAILSIADNAEIIELPVGDGGEGTLEILTYASQGKLIETKAADPLGNPIQAQFAISGDGNTAFVEMAQASGLQLICQSLRNPLITTTYGTGELIRQALDYPIQNLMITIGGSATNDCGAGMLQALGAKLLDANNHPVGFGGGNLKAISKVDFSELDPRLKQVSIKVACDVTNPLIGPRGATHIFGPQKGATPKMVAFLEESLTHFANLIESETGMSLQHVSGAGAAGGLGAALMLCGGTLEPGIDLVLDALSFDGKVAGADYVFTGEGKIDSQTPDGKVIAGIVQRSNKAGVPVIAFAGSVQPGYEKLYEAGLLSTISITPKPVSLEEALRQGEENLFNAVCNTVRLLQYRKKH